VSPGEDSNPVSLHLSQELTQLSLQLEPENGWDTSHSRHLKYITTECTRVHMSSIMVKKEIRICLHMQVDYEVKRLLNSIHIFPSSPSPPLSLLFNKIFLDIKALYCNTSHQGGQCILFSVVFTPPPPSNHGSVWLLPVISLLLTNTISSVRACQIIGWETFRRAQKKTIGGLYVLQSSLLPIFRGAKNSC
jgi:hypothetical protein